MSVPIKPFYVAKPSTPDMRGHSEPKLKKQIPIPYNQYIKHRDVQKYSTSQPLKQNTAIDKIKQKICQTNMQTQWQGLIAKTLSIEQNLSQIRDSVSKSLKQRGESTTQDRFSKDTSSSKSTSHPELVSGKGSQHSKIIMTQDLNSSLYAFQLKTSQIDQVPPQVQKVNMTSRITTPMISKKASSFKTVQHKETPLTMTMSRIQFDNGAISCFGNKTSQGWFQKPTPKYQQIDSLPQFQIGRKLGKGQFSEVFMCIEKNTGMIFALKRVKKEQVKEPQLMRQLQLEIKVQSELNHKNILKLYTHYQDTVYIYLLLEYCNEGELFKHQRKQQHQRYSEQVAANYIFQVAECVKYMHDANVMHRDLKTENIMLSYNQIKIGDLGCVCSNNRRRETFCGTIEFMAPEVIKMEGYDQRVDAWQIAVLAYELVQGCTPFVMFGCKDQNQIMNNIVRNCMNIPQFFSPSLQQFIKGGLQSDPNSRITVDQMLHHPWIVTNRQSNKTSINFHI